MSTIDTSTWNPDADLNVEIEGIPLNANASIMQTWQVIRILMAAFKGDTSAIQALMVPFSGATASTDGTQGFVPAPEAGDEDKVLKGDGTWGAAPTPNLGTASRVVQTDANGELAVSGVTATELGCLSGVTSAVQTQISSKVSKSGDTMTGSLSVRASNVNLSVEPTSLKEDWRFLITKSSADTTHTGSLMRLGVGQSANTKDYRITLGVSNPRAGNLPTQESIARGDDDSDAITSNCWGSIGVYYDYSKNRAYPCCYGLTTCDLSDDSTERLATNRWVRRATGNFACNAATAVKLAGPRHSYTTAANQDKAWLRIANANTSPINPDKPLHMQFFIRMNASDAGVGFWQSWFVDVEVCGSQAGIRIFGNNSAAPYSQARVLYEGTAASVTASVRPAVDIYLNNVLAGGTVVEVEEVNNSGFDFVADGVLAASVVPSGYENRATLPYGNGINQAQYADYASLPNTTFSTNTTLNTTGHTRRPISCTGTITITLPSVNSSTLWYLVKNCGTGVVTLHPTSASVYIDDVSADITLQPGEYILLACQSNAHYSIFMDGRWKSKLAALEARIAALEA